MNNLNQFNIKIKKSTPYVSKGLFWLSCFFAGILAIFFFIILPSNDNTVETSAFYFELVIPYFLKITFGIAFVGLISSLVLYHFSKINNRATLVFHPKCLTINGKNFCIKIHFDDIMKVHFNDLKNFKSLKMLKTEIAIKKKDNKHTVFTLDNYYDSENVLFELSKIPNVDFQFYDTSMQVANEE